MRKPRKVALDLVLGAALLAYASSFVGQSISSAVFVGLIGVMWFALAGYDGGLFPDTATAARTFVAITGLIFGGLAVSSLVHAFWDWNGFVWRVLAFLCGAFFSAVAAVLLYGAARGPQAER